MTDATAATKPIDVATKAGLDAVVDETDLVLVEFYTEGCGLCASLDPVLGNVARATDAAVVTVNPRDDPPLVEEYAIRSVPTLILFEDGTQVGRLDEGFQGTEAIVDFVENQG
ncbi:thioredoxin family protein [Salinirarus marinus]|uniref:thioredoxin family protein n=1 Tax=Salinirarus marinus TaxID=3068310 RepID=UPI003C6C388C